MIRAGEPQSGAREQEQRELGDDQHARSHERELRVTQPASGEQPLHDQLIGPVRGGGQERAAYEAAPEAVQHGERRSEVERHELPRRPGPRERRGPAGELRRHDQRRDPAQDVDAQLHHVHPDDGAKAADPGVDHRDQADRQDPGGEAPVGDDREGDGGREHAHAVGQRPREQEDPGGHPPGPGPEAALQALVGGVLGPLEVAGQEQGRDADPTDQIAEADLQEGQVGARGDAGNRDHRQRRRLRRDDGEHQRPPRQAAMAQEVIARVALPPRQHQPDDEHGAAIDRDDRYVEGAHRRAAKSPREARASEAGSSRANGLRP